MYKTKTFGNLGVDIIHGPPPWGGVWGGSGVPTVNPDVNLGGEGGEGGGGSFRGGPGGSGGRNFRKFSSNS